MTAGTLRIYDVNVLCLSIGIPFCGALPFFYTFTGRDTVSSFSMWENSNFMMLSLGV